MSTITLNQTAPAAPTTKPAQGDGHYYGFTKERGWFPLYKDGGTFGLREARKMHEAGEIAMPSATGVIKCMHKHQIEVYKQEEAAKAALRLKPDDFPTEDEWLDAVIDLAGGASRPAMDKGVAIHDAIEKCIKGEEYNAEYAIYVEPVMKELAAHGMFHCEAEKCTGSLKHGIAGKLDIIDRPTIAIGDTKTRGHKILKTKPSKVPCYETDLMQVASYGYCEFGNAFFISGRALILGVSTVQPGLVTPHLHEGKDLVPAFEAFLALTAVWRYTHNCDPRRPLFLEGGK